VLTKKVIKKKVRAARDQQIILNGEVCFKGYTGVNPATIGVRANLTIVL